jgi:hypothetical protein
MQISSVSTVVAEELVKLGSQKVVDSVVNVLVSKEIEKRSSLLLKAVEEFDSLKRESYRFKPDVLSYDTSGQEVSSAWSKSNLEARNKHSEKMYKLEQLVEKTISSGDWSQLNNYLSKKNES